MLSKSRLLHHRQCPKRLWLNQNRPELKQDDLVAEARMANGNRLGEMARELHPGGVLIDGGNLSRAIEDTTQALKGRKRPIYEATFAHKEVLVRADLLLPVRGGYRLVEVKSSGELKPYHVEDAAIQAWVIRNAGLEIKRVEIAHVNTGFVYTGRTDQRTFAGGEHDLDCPGVGEYGGLLAHVDVSMQVEDLASLVPKWVSAARKTLKGEEPEIEPGEQCTKPFACPFQAYCIPEVTGYPVEVLKDKLLVAELRSAGYSDLRKVPKSRLSKTKHLRLWQATKTGRAVLEPTAAETLAGLPYPRYYLDFETIQFTVPIWTGTRAYQQLPFQWSCHIEDKSGGLRHAEYLAKDVGDPRREFAETLIRTLRTRGPVFVYNQAFEATRLLELTTVFLDLAPALEAIIKRMVDLLPIARDNYYHRDMRGSWSIKAVLPTIAPELDYGDLTVANGGMASLAFAKIIDEATSASERQTLRQNLLAYCQRDTLAMVRLAHHFQGR
jgi:hypothetical protein